MQCYPLIFADEKFSYCKSLQILVLGFIAPCFAGKFTAKIMTSRSMQNSQAVAFHAMIFPADIKTSAANSSLPSTSSPEPQATSQSPTLD